MVEINWLVTTRDFHDPESKFFLWQRLNLNWLRFVVLFPTKKLQSRELVTNTSSITMQNNETIQLSFVMFTHCRGIRIHQQKSKQNSLASRSSPFARCCCSKFQQPVVLVTLQYGSSFRVRETLLELLSRNVEIEDESKRCIISLASLKANDYTRATNYNNKE